MVAAAKLPMLNPNEFELWKMRIEHYFLMTDYALWEVILNGDSPPPKRTVDGVEQTYPLTTVEEKLARKNELKARAIEKRFGGNKESKKVQKTLLKQQYENFNGNSSEGLDQIYDRLQKLISQLEIHGEIISQEDVNLKLLRSLPSEWKTHTLIWRNKSDLDTMSMDDLYNNLKIYETEVKGSSSTSQNTQNVAFVSSNNTGSTNEAVKTAHGVSAANFKANASTLPNVDSLSDVVIYSFFASQSNSSQLDNEDLKQIDPDDLEEMDLKAPKHEDNRNKKITRRTVPVEETTYAKALVAQDGFRYDWSDQAEEGPTNFALMAYTSSSSSSLDTKILKLDIMLRDNALTELRKKFEKAEKEIVDLKLTLEKFENSSKNLSKLLDSQVSDKFKTGVGYDSQVFDSQVFNSQVNDMYKTGEGYHVVPPPYTGNIMPPKPDLVLAAKDEYVFSESSLPAVATSEVKTSESKPKFVSEPLIEDWISNSEDENETKSKQRKLSFAKVEFIKSNEYVKSPRESVKKVETNKQAKYPRKNSQSPRGNQRNWNNLMTRKLGSNFEFKNKACYVCGSFNHLIKDYDAKKMVEKPVWNNARRVNHQHSQRMTHPHPKGNFVPKAVLMKSGLKTLNTVRQNSLRAALSVNVVRPINTAYPRPTVNCAKPASNVFNRAHSHVKRPFNKTKAVVSDNKGNKANVVKASACCIWRPKQKVLDHGNPQQDLKDKGVIDSGCSRHMTENRSYLTNYEEIDGGFVAFGGSTKGGKITGKGKIRTGKLDFEDVYFVKQLKFNLFSDSQMCDKKNSVLFTDTECVVLSLDFKLTDESHVLLKVPRKDNMYNVDLKNVVPQGGLTCLFAKATPDESNIWHRRLRHVNFKTINKLVRGNLVRGLPSKLFEINQTCVACQKGKQHRASCIKPSLSFMRPFGCPVIILNTIDHLGKFDEKADERFFVGYSTNIKAFRVFNSRTRIVEENLHVKFSEDTPNIAGSGPNWIFDIDALTKSMNYEPVVAGNQSNGNAGTKACDDAAFSSSSKDSPNARLKPSEEEEKKDAEDPENEDSEVPNTEEPGVNQDQDENVDNINTVSSTVNAAGIEDNDVHENIVYGCVHDPNIPNLEEIAYSDDDEGVGAEADMTNLDTHILFSPILTTRIYKDHPIEQIIRDIHSAPQTRRMTKSVTDHVEPKKVCQALTDLSWIEAIQDELLQLKRKFMMRVTQGYTQEEGIDYDKVFALVARIEAIRLFLAYDSFKDFIMYQMDVKSAFLYSKIEEEVYVCQPLGFEDPEFPHRVYKVEKALYGLRQAPRAWYETLSTYLLDNRFQRGQIDKNLFIKRVKGDILLVQVYVHDIIFGSTKKEMCIEFEKMMHNRFQISSMRELTFFLGLQVTQKDDGIFISQDKYVDEILKKFGFSTVRIASTPMETSNPLLKDAEAEDVDVHLYRSMIGSLMYLTSSRPDIMFVVCACARFQVTLKVSHLHAVKRIFRYLKGQLKLGLWYPKDSPFDLEAYSDSDYADASLDRKSITGGCQFLGSRLISWQCKKQTVVANSTIEAEYVAASSYYRQVLWIQNQLLDYGYNFMNTKIFIDNESTICIVKNLVFHSKTKHIEIHSIRDSNEKKLIQMIKIHTDQNVADLFTKAFDVSRFQYLIAINDEIQVSVVGLTYYYALTVNPIIYTSCIKQLWATAKAKTVNREVQIQALVDRKKVIVTETSVRRALHLKDAEGQIFLIHSILQCLSAKTTAWNEFNSTMASVVICLATNQKFNFSKYIFDNMVKNLEGGVKFLMYPRFVQVFLDKQVEGMSKHKEIYDTPSHSKKVFANMKREGKGFSGRDTPLFQTMMEELGEGSEIPIDPQHTPTTTQPSTSQPQKKQKPRRKQKMGTEIPSTSGEPIADKDANVASVSTHSSDPLLSGEDRLKLTELMDLLKKLEKKKKSRSHGLRRLYKVGSSRRVESSEESLGAQEDASKQGRKIADIDADAEVTLIDETQGRNDEDLMFDTGVLDGDEVFVETEEPVVNVATTTKSIPVSVVDPVTTAGEVVTTASVEILDELTLAQTLIEIKTAKPKVVTTTATTVTPVRPKAKGIIFHDQEEQAPASTLIVSSSQSQLP
ncbi:putative ribonuclease H-like domain-containing protein [Tanacetum coccineum]|uniref:Ribonuclease H-like domain-containing protein n=1 Tax=Tanacetum coccineum TaxID=301880 RepID=A0ABQ5HYI9_9ASTR